MKSIYLALRHVNSGTLKLSKPWNETRRAYEISKLAFKFRACWVKLRVPTNLAAPICTKITLEPNQMKFNYQVSSPRDKFFTNTGLVVKYKLRQASTSTSKTSLRGTLIMYFHLCWGSKQKCLRSKIMFLEFFRMLCDYENVSCLTYEKLQWTWYV